MKRKVYISPMVEIVEIQENSPLLITSISADNGSGGDLGLGYDDNGGDADEALGRMLFGDWNF